MHQTGIMPMPARIRPNDKAIKAYYARRAELDAQGVSHELAIRDAFENLLAETARGRGWTLVTELSKQTNGRTITPDGTLRDEWQLPHGYWEAKDTHDDLDTEIRKKRERGYPFTNILFEDSRQGVLFQDGQEVFRANLSVPQDLADLLSAFLSYAAPNIESFKQAVQEFQQRIPDLARGLNARIKEAHQRNPAFNSAYERFYALCREALNPNLSRDAVDEMLIQHLLTERLLHTVFNMPEFAQRNVIASEVEEVIRALTGAYFNRHEFLGALDRFYDIIENTARDLRDFGEKQRFLNAVYERFFQGYSVKVADTHGIIYTPQEIVNFMVAAVEEVLHTEFGKSLGDEGVVILDPCTGTGNFIVHILRRIHPRRLERAYHEQLFANEVMLMPYYIATLNIEHAYYELTGRYEPFEGVCFVDTLDLAEGRQLPLFVEANTARVEREKDAPITVIIGNPPYNVGQLNENDNNKNREYPIVDRRVSETYAKDSTASNKNALFDAYVKFFRWATDRLGDRDGIVCFVSNNSFVDQIAFDGMRKHLLQDFTRVYHVDLHGNVRQNPKLSGTTHNVFGIQVGVGITVAVRAARHKERRLFYHRVPEFWRKEEKLAWLASTSPPGPLSIHGEGELGGAYSPSPQVERGWGEVPANTTPEMWDALKPLARQMRREATPAEDRLWQRLRNRQVAGYKFRRQHAIDRFIVDFYCAQARLVVEVDGPIHDYTAEEDAIRQEFLESLGLSVIRFSNEDVLRHTDWVIEQIAEALTASRLLSAETSPRPLSTSGEGPEAAQLASPSPFMERGPGGEVVLQTVPWQPLTPDHRHTWLVSEHADEFASFLPIGTKEAKAAERQEEVEAIFRLFSNGVKTNRDTVVYDFNQPALIERVQQFIEDYNSEVDRWRRAGNKGNVDDFVRYDRIKWSRDLKLDLRRGNYAEYQEFKVRLSLYRPFSKQHLFFDRILNEEVYVLSKIFPTPSTEAENLAIILTDRGSEKPFMTLIANTITDLHLVGPGAGSQCFPFYVYEPHPHPSPQVERGYVRRENITDWALAQFRGYYGDDSIEKWDLFYYVYGLLHHPGYRERYADNLKRELPRIPFAPDFWAFSEAGRALADLHLNYETVEPYPLQWVHDDEAGPLSFRVEKMRLRNPHPSSPASEGGAEGGYKTYRALEINETLTLRGIPAEAFDYRLGNRSALEWVIDQYQVKTDARSGIMSDPNSYAPDNPRYIVELVERVIRVSVETVRIVASLPEDFRA